MIESTIFIGALIAGITQAIKLIAPKVTGWVTILVAMVVGALVALVDTEIGVADVSIAQGILTGLATAGVTAIAQRK